MACNRSICLKKIEKILLSGLYYHRNWPPIRHIVLSNGYDFIHNVCSTMLYFQNKSLNSSNEHLKQNYLSSFQTIA